MSTPNSVNLNNLDGRYVKPADVTAAIASQATTDAGQYATRLQAYRTGLRAYDNLFPVADLANPPTASSDSGGTNTCGNYSTRHYTHTSFDSLVVEFSNYNVVGYAGEQENSAGNSITVRAAWWSLDGSLKLPLYSNGSRDLIIGPGGRAKFDPIGLSVAAGTEFYIRSTVSCVSGGKWWMNGIVSQSARPGEGLAVGTTYQDLTLTGSLSGANFAFKPSALLGTVVNYKPFTALLGDSILHGFNDSDMGFAYRAFRPSNIASVKVATPGDRANSWINKGLSFRRRTYISGATYGIWEYGVNDLNGGRTAAQLESDAVMGWTEQVTYNALKLFATTLTPWTTSTDSWATTGNQTVTSWEAQRVAYNTWLRAGAPINSSTKAPVAVGTAGALVAGNTGHPLINFIEIADLAETARNSGIWRTDLGAPTTDGIHPTAVISSALAAAVPTAQIAL